MAYNAESAGKLATDRRISLTPERALYRRARMAQKRNSVDALFRAAEGAERAFNRRKAAELRQNARAAQQQKNWPAAERLWRQSLEEDPGDKAALIGLANALVYIGKLDEAKAFADGLVGEWPEDENGALLLARLAEERGDTEDAIRHWRRTLALSPAKTQAMIRLGRLLIGEGDFPGAEDCAARLVRLAPANPAGPSLLAEIDEAKGDRASGLARRKALTVSHAQTIQVWRDYGIALIAAREFADCEALIEALAAMDRQDGLRMRGLWLAEREPEKGHSAFWREAHGAFPANTDFLRKYLHASLRDGALDDVRAGLEALLSTGQLREADSAYVIGLVNLLGEDRPAIRSVVRRFLKALKRASPYRLAALRLSRIVLRDFPRAPLVEPTARTLRMLERAPVEPGAAATIRATAALAQSFPALRRLVDTDVARAEAEAFVAEVRGRLTAAAPFSFIRLGDGESNALDYAPDIARFADGDAAEREVVWWGRALDPSERAPLNARVREAIVAADGYGIPAMDRVLRDLRLDQADSLARTRVGRGLRTLLAVLGEGGALRAPKALIASAHLQHDLERWDLYKALFQGLDGMVAVSCHDRLPEALPLALNIVVPSRHASLAAFGIACMGPKILPEVLDETIARLPADLRGRLVIVGAGYAGKVIVHEAARRGAVALDLGSVLDYWMGAATRSYVTASTPRTG
jgi:tetratricopeptide (TPR) repeat protein